MSYNYEDQKSELFTENGIDQLLEIRDKVKDALAEAGSFMSVNVFAGGDTWTSMAALDYLVEKGEIREVTGPDVMCQHRVFVQA